MAQYQAVVGVATRNNLTGRQLAVLHLSCGCIAERPMYKGRYTLVKQPTRMLCRKHPEAPK